jgi:hypothetical protein
MNAKEELFRLWTKKWDKKLEKFLEHQVIQKQSEILETLKEIIHTEKENGKIIADSARAYFRIKRIDNKDCAPLYELYDTSNTTLTESLLDVLGYDKMIPEIPDQQKIIETFFDFGNETDYKYYTDPRYGLAAACAGWELPIVESFLKYCLEIPDAPLKYVAENSLKRKYVRLR